MAFITHCWKKFLHLEPLLLSGLQGVWHKLAKKCVGLVTALLFALSGVAHADTPVELQGLKLERQDTALYLSANWRFDLPTALEDALLKGITLYFVTELEIN